MYNDSVFLDQQKFSWAFLAHLGYNMWADPVRDKRGVPGIPQSLTQVCAEDHLRFDLDLWHKTTKELAAAGCNMKAIPKSPARVRGRRRFCRKKSSI